MNKLDGFSGTLFAGATALLASDTFGPIWSKIAAGALTLVALLVARFTPVPSKPLLPPKDAP